MDILMAANRRHKDAQRQSGHAQTKPLMPRSCGDGTSCVSAFLFVVASRSAQCCLLVRARRPAAWCAVAYQVMFIPTVRLALELNGIISLLVLPSMWSIPMKKL